MIDAEISSRLRALSGALAAAERQLQPNLDAIRAELLLIEETCRPIGQYEGGRVRSILRLASVAFALPVADIVGASRYKGYARARFAIAWVERQCHRPASYPQIAHVLGGRDHSTIVQAVKRAAALRAAEPEFRQVTDQLLAFFKQETPQCQH